jgi:hypothetical protein
MFSQQNWRTRGQNRLCLEAREVGEWGVRESGRGVEARRERCPKTMYTHMNKYKNNLKK